MNIKNLFGTIGLFLVALLVVATGVSADHQVPLFIEEAEINDVEIFQGDVNKLDLERNQEFELKLTLVADEDVKNVEVLAFVSGYEYNRVERISDSTPLFDADKDVRYVKKLRLRLPDELEEDHYKLRVVISDRNGAEVVETYDLKVDVPRHKLRIEHVSLFPSSVVKGGQALLAKVRLKNKGEKDERDVKVTFSVPDLGLRGTDFVDEVETEREEDSEEVYLKLPKCAKPGDYNMVVEVSFDNDHQKVSTTKVLTVEENEACKEAPAVSSQPSTSQPSTPTPADAPVQKSKLRSALEMVLVVLVALLVVIGLVIGFSKLKEDDE